MMEGERRESEEVGAGTPTKMKMGLGQLDVSKEVNHTQSESLKVYMDNHITLSRVSRMDNGLMNELSSENLNMNDLIHSSIEDGFHSSQDTCLNSMGEHTADPLKYTLNTENENAVLEVKMQPCTQYYDDEGLGKYQRLPEDTSLEEETCPYLPQLQLLSCNSHAPSSLMTQHRKSVLSFDTTTPNGTVNTNIEIIPVLKPLLTEDANNCVSCDEIKGIINTATMSQQLLGYAGESCNGISTSSLDIALAPDELAEVRDAVVSITANNSEEEAFHNSNNGATNHKLAVSQNAVEGPMCSHRNCSNPQVIICQLKSGTHILCISNADTRELKAIHLLAPKQESEQYLQPDAANSITSARGQFLPVVSKLNVCTQEQLDNGSIHTYSDSNLQEPMKLTLVGLPCGSWDTKSKKPCNCTKSQCLKLYCDCFANGDFCNNCNCNNCYNNPQHDIERFKAIKACLDRNPEAFLPKIGKGKLGDIKPRHNKGCNCKRSGCLKNYCECFEAKIMCSSICKCVGCKNYEGSPDRKILINMPNHMEIKSDSVSFSDLEILANSRKDRHFSTCISWEVVEATCACLLAQAEEAEKEAFSVCLAEEMILEEFGRCLAQILHSEFKSKGLKVE